MAVRKREHEDRVSATSVAAVTAGSALGGGHAPSHSDSSPRLAAMAAAVGFAGVGAFQVALAAGVPWGHAAYGGADADLSASLRLASVVAAGFYGVVAPLIVLGRAGQLKRSASAAAFRRGTWVLVALMTLGALVNFASQSRWENYLWGPVTVALAILCAVVAHRAARADPAADRA